MKTSPRLVTVLLAVTMLGLGISGCGQTDDPSPNSSEVQDVGSGKNPSTGRGCFENVLCVKNSHFDRQACRCVVDCVQTACPQGTHWDLKGCKCVEDAPPPKCDEGEHWDATRGICIANPPQCQTADTCSGALPDLCRICPNGSSDCAHWACKLGSCAVSLCD